MKPRIHLRFTFETTNLKYGDFEFDRLYCQRRHFAVPGLRKDILGFEDGAIVLWSRELGLVGTDIRRNVVRFSDRIDFVEGRAPTDQHVLWRITASPEAKGYTRLEYSKDDNRYYVWEDEDRYVLDPETGKISRP